MRYSQGFKASIVKKTQDGSGRSVYQIAREAGIVKSGENFPLLSGEIFPVIGKITPDNSGNISSDMTEEHCARL